jgi:hypothetical protein
VRNLVSHTEVGTKTEGVREKDAEENIGPKRDKVKRECRRLHNEEPNGLYSSPNIVRMIKSRIMRWAGRVARTGEKRSA